MFRNKTKRIAELNDLCRREMGLCGPVVDSFSIAMLPAAVRWAIHEKVERFDNFTPTNDPKGERNFGSFEHAGEIFVWKIDYYDDLGLTKFSEDPSDQGRTIRVVSIMLASEY
jgi:hypothetical protein